MKAGLSRKSFVLFLSIVLMVGFASAFAQQKQQRRRPAARRSAKAKDTRVYLVHADVLHYDQLKNPDATILNGKVHFTHQGVRLYCDSAYFYEASNSFEAFGHVKMYQGDTLSLLSDYAYYDGNEQMARARYNVVLKHKKTTLYTDSLDYDRLYDNAYFFEGGKMIDGKTTLTSDWGEYNTKSKMSVFNYDVKMKSPKFFLTTDTLYYDTRLSMAHIVGPSNITSGDSHIYSEQGYYDTKNDRARLMNRSVLSNQGKMMVGDSVYYDSKQGFSQAFRNVVYVDSLNKNKLTGNYGEYYEKTGFALCTDSAVAIDYSQGDSLFMHADTFKVVTYNIETDSVYRKIFAFHHVRAFRNDVQAVCDSLIYNSRLMYDALS
jgi:lipopolysaccharide assembly outer membrane protein LptD (OstA)